MGTQDVHAWVTTALLTCIHVHFLPVYVYFVRTHVLLLRMSASGCVAPVGRAGPELGLPNWIFEAAVVYVRFAHKAPLGLFLSRHVQDAILSIIDKSQFAPSCARFLRDSSFGVPSFGPAYVQ